MKPIKESMIADISRNGYLGVERKIPQEERKEARKRYANLAISIWLHAVASDNYQKVLERKKVLDFIKLLFQEGSLFPEPEYSDSDQKKILMELVAITDLISLDAIAEYLSDKKEIALAFFHDACLIVFLDGRVVSTENDFLESIAGKFALSKMDKEKILEQFRKNL
ncbi:MAG: hypothetical protein SFU98_14620 [Leptospiraceae bacterium]|nr:hypothetical protein [Leptospiraceae bacterium]